MAALLVNPRKRRSTRRKVAKKRPARRRTSLATVKTVSTRRYRRNPSARTNITSTVKDGAIGAVGAIASEFVLSKLPLPAEFSTGPMQTAASALVSVGVGLAVSKFGKKHAIGAAMAKGGVTVALHQTMRGLVAGPLGIDGGLAYYGDDFNEMGYVEPTAVFDEADDLDGYYEN